MENRMKKVGKVSSFLTKYIGVIIICFSVIAFFWRDGFAWTTRGVPEYVDAKGRGVYHYLTGAASWLLVTVITQMFGVRGQMGNLAFVPQIGRASCRERVYVLV